MLAARMRGHQREGLGSRIPSESWSVHRDDAEEPDSPQTEEHGRAGDHGGPEAKPIGQVQEASHAEADPDPHRDRAAAPSQPRDDQQSVEYVIERLIRDAPRRRERPIGLGQVLEQQNLVDEHAVIQAVDPVERAIGGDPPFDQEGDESRDVIERQYPRCAGDGDRSSTETGPVR